MNDEYTSVVISIKFTTEELMRISDVIEIASDSVQQKSLQKKTQGYSTIFF